MSSIEEVWGSPSLSGAPNIGRNGNVYYDKSYSGYQPPGDRYRVTPFGGQDRGAPPSHHEMPYVHGPPNPHGPPPHQQSPPPQYHEPPPPPQHQVAAGAPAPSESAAMATAAAEAERAAAEKAQERQMYHQLSNRLGEMEWMRLKNYFKSKYRRKCKRLAESGALGPVTGAQCGCVGFSQHMTECSTCQTMCHKKMEFQSSLTMWLLIGIFILLALNLIVGSKKRK